MISAVTALPNGSVAAVFPHSELDMTSPKRQQMILVAWIEQNLLDRRRVVIGRNWRHASSHGRPGMAAVGTLVRSAHRPHPDRERVSGMPSERCHFPRGETSRSL